MANEIVKETLHPESNENVDIYPKTDAEQVIIRLPYSALNSTLKELLDNVIPETSGVIYYNATTEKTTVYVLDASGSIEGSIVQRDGVGQVKGADGASAKAYVTALQMRINLSKKGVPYYGNLNNYSPSKLIDIDVNPNGETIVQRTSDGRVKSSEGVAQNDCVVVSQLSNFSGLKYKHWSLEYNVATEVTRLGYVGSITRNLYDIITTELSGFVKDVTISGEYLGSAYYTFNMMRILQSLPISSTYSTIFIPLSFAFSFSGKCLNGRLNCYIRAYSRENNNIVDSWEINIGKVSLLYNNTYHDFIPYNNKLRIIYGRGIGEFQES